MPNLFEHLQEIERYVIQLAINCTGGNVSEAARHLGINRTTLAMKLEPLGIVIPERPEKPEPAIKKARIFHNRFSEFKEQSIMDALEEHEWNRTWAADYLGISVRSLRNWIEDMRARGHDIPDSPNTGWRGRKKPSCNLALG